jgi:hypothetical protein
MIYGGDMEVRFNIQPATSKCRKDCCLVWHLRELAARQGWDPDSSELHAHLAGQIGASEAAVCSLMQNGSRRVPDLLIGGVLKELQVDPITQQNLKLAWQRYQHRQPEANQRECCQGK